MIDDNPRINRIKKITTFRDLVVWEKSHTLTLAIYKLTRKFPDFERFGLSSQIQRSSSSVPSNIAEGFKKNSLKDSLHFYNIADCSLEETKYQLILARDLGYISEAEFTQTSSIAEETGKLLNGWMKSLKDR